MNPQEKILYHQIHPIKLGVDLASGVVSTWLMWTHDFWLGMGAAWVPTVLVSSFMVWRMDFARQRNSAPGRYLAFHMTRPAEAVRMAGQIGMWIGAWQHSVLAIALSLMAIVFGWTYSLPKWRKRASRENV